MNFNTHFVADPTDTEFTRSSTNPPTLVIRENLVDTYPGTGELPVIELSAWSLLGIYNLIQDCRMKLIGEAVVNRGYSYGDFYVYTKIPLSSSGGLWKGSYQIFLIPDTMMSSFATPKWDKTPEDSIRNLLTE